MKNFRLLLLCLLMACKVTLITGYDPVIDETATKMKHDFNMMMLKLAREVQDQNPTNQAFPNYQDYYDNLQTDLLILRDRAVYTGPKGEIVRKQITNADSLLTGFMHLHQQGFPDRPGDDKRDFRNAVNSALNAISQLQEALKSTGKAD
jgi:hypothetical protein